MYSIVVPGAALRDFFRRRRRTFVFLSLVFYPLVIACDCAGRMILVANRFSFAKGCHRWLEFGFVHRRYARFLRKRSDSF